ncbi:unnamed protein product, partial [Rotaria sp. Silwood2]
LRQKLERKIRRLEGEVQELREQLHDRMQQIHLARREDPGETILLYDLIRFLQDDIRTYV